MNTSSHTNRSNSRQNKRKHAITVTTVDGFIDENKTEKEKGSETENENDKIVFNNDDEIIQFLNSLLVQYETSWKQQKDFLEQQKDFLATVKAEEEFLAMKVQILKNTKQSFIDHYMTDGNIVPKLKPVASTANATIVITKTAAVQATTSATADIAEADNSIM